MSSRVPTNSLHSAIVQNANEIQRPASGEYHFARGFLTDVFDRERIDLGDVPDEVIEKVQLHPGVLYGRVQVPPNSTYILPFEQSHDEILLLGGNAYSLEGRFVQIKYRNNNIKNQGVIMFTSDYNVVPLNMTAATEVWSVGGIFG